MILFTILILIVYYKSKRNVWISNWRKRAINQPYNYYVLLGLLVVGFFLQLDYTDRWGCLTGGESIFDYKNILFSSISISLILLSFFLKQRIFKISFVLAEIAFWIIKLFYFKGGYVVSIAGMPDPIISFYDTLTLSLRLFIISSLIKSNIKTIYILICSLVIIAIKVFVFPTQFSMIDEEKKSLQKAAFTKEMLVGEWIGTYKYDSTIMDETIHLIDTAKIRFDTNQVTLINFLNVDSIQLFLEFRSEFSGQFHDRKKDNWENYYDFWIGDLTADSLEITLTKSFYYYRFKMRKSITLK